MKDEIVITSRMFLQSSRVREGEEAVRDRATKTGSKMTTEVERFVGGVNSDIANGASVCEGIEVLEMSSDQFLPFLNLQVSDVFSFTVFMLQEPSP